MLSNEWLPGMSAKWPHFDETEMRCQCGCGKLPEPVLMMGLETLRRDLGFPLPVSSGARCPQHNASVSSTGFHGPHTTGLAADITVDRGRAFELMQAVMVDARWTGIGWKQKGSSRFVHLDIIPVGRDVPRPTIWSY